jgi:hypothetical protein
MLSKEAQLDKIKKPFLDALAMYAEYGGHQHHHTHRYRSSGSSPMPLLLPLPLFAQALQYLGVELSFRKLSALALAFAPVDEYEKEKERISRFDLSMRRKDDNDNNNDDGEEGVDGRDHTTHVDVQQFVEWLVSSLPTTATSHPSQRLQLGGGGDGYDYMWWELEEEIAWRLIELLREGGEGFIEEMALKFLQSDRMGKGKVNLWGLGNVLETMGLILNEEELHGLMKALGGGKGIYMRERKRDDDDDDDEVLFHAYVCINIISITFLLHRQVGCDILTLSLFLVFLLTLTLLSLLLSFIHIYRGRI